MELNFAKSEVSRLQQNLQDLQEGNRALQVKLTVSFVSCACSASL